MHRKKGATEAASYIWVRERNIEQELARLQQQSAMYRMNYGCRADLGDRSEMIFEQPSVRDGKQREYKVLALELKNGTQELKRLTNDGFEVRDLFDCHLSDKKNKSSRVKILLERVSQPRDGAAAAALIVRVDRITGFLKLTGFLSC